MTSDSHDIKQIRKSYEEKKRIDINPTLHDAFFGQKWPMKRVANKPLRTYLSSNGSWDFTLLSTSIDIQHANFYLFRQRFNRYTTFRYKNFRNIIQVKICKMQLVGREREVVIFSSHLFCNTTMFNLGALFSLPSYTTQLFCIMRIIKNP